MQDILFNFFLTSLSVSCLIPFVSICFMLFKNRLSVRSKYYIWIGVILSLLLPFRPAFSLGLIEVQPPAPLLPATRPPQLESAPIEASGMPLAAYACYSVGLAFRCLCLSGTPALQLFQI